MSAQHTPGPWCLSARRNNDMQSQWFGVFIAGAFVEICTRHAEADACLIAAAPELLEAAAAIDANAEECEGPDGAAYMVSADLLHALQDAIAKATGDVP